MQDQQEGIVTIVEDDTSLRGALERLLTEIGYTVRAFASAEEFLKVSNSKPCHCVLVDVNLPGLSGLELQQHLLKQKAIRYIIFMTGYGEVPIAVEAMKHGAVDFLLKPIDEDLLVFTVEKALRLCRQHRRRDNSISQAKESFAKLTPRETDVMLLVIEGQPNKIIADNLNIAVQTVKIHRGRVMAKLAVESVVDLVHLAEKAEVQLNRSLQARKTAD